MTFTAHLGELRTRMIRSIAALTIGFFVCYYFSENIIDGLSMPLRGLAHSIPSSVDTANPAVGQSVKDYGGVSWVVLTPFEPVLVKLKISAYAGLVMALPFIVYQICAFVFPGLTATEKRIVRTMLFSGFALALAGVSVAYFLIFPPVLTSIIQYAPAWVRVTLRLNDTLSVILKGIMAFGVAFQMPMVIVVLVYLGILSPATLKAYRKVAIVIIFVLAAILTPPDPISQTLMALPLIGLYEVSIWVSYAVVRRNAKAAAAAGA